MLPVAPIKILDYYIRLHDMHADIELRPRAREVLGVLVDQEVKSGKRPFKGKDRQVLLKRLRMTKNTLGIHLKELVTKGYLRKEEGYTRFFTDPALLDMYRKLLNDGKISFTLSYEANNIKSVPEDGVQV